MPLFHARYKAKNNHYQEADETIEAPTWEDALRYATNDSHEFSLVRLELLPYSIRD